MLLPFLSAFFGIVAFLPYSLYPFSFIFLAPFFIFLLREGKLWRLITGTLLFRFIFSMGTVYYTLEPILWTLSLLIFCGLPLSIFLLKKYFRWPDLSLFIILPIAFSLFDLLQAKYSLAPIFIATAGNALGSSPFLGLAGLGGFVTLTLFVTSINALLAVVFLTWRLNRQAAYKLSAAIVVILLLGWQISSFVLHQNESQYNSLPNSLSVAIVSTNKSFQTCEFTDVVAELSAQKIDLIVFPENIFNQHMPSDGKTFQDTAKTLSTPVLATYDTLQEGKKYDSSVFFDSAGTITSTHNKARLTFAGEYWPFGEWRPSFYDWLRERDPSIGTYALFGAQNAMDVGKKNLLSANIGEESILFATPICLEMHYPDDLSEYKAAGARFIVNPSSNRWLDVGLNHFLYLTTNLKKIESVSLRLPVISSGVDEFASIIYPSGESVDSSPSGRNYTILFDVIRY